MGATRPENSAEDAGPEAGKGPVLPEPIGVPGENTDDVPDDGTQSREQGRQEGAGPQKDPADDPDLDGEDRFDAG